MIEQNVLGQKERWGCCIATVLIAYVFVAHMVIDASGEWSGLFHYMNMVRAISEISIIFLCIFMFRSGKKSAMLVAAYLVWLVISRPLCGDINLTASIEHITIVALCTSIMCYALLLEPVYRCKVIAAFFAIVYLFYLVIAISIVYVALTRTAVRLPLDITVGIKSEGTLVYVTTFGRQRSIAAQWNCLSFCLASYLLYICRSRVIRIFICISEAFFFAAVALSLSRTSMVSLAVAVAMISALIAQKLMLSKKAASRIMVSLLIAIAVLPAAYKLQGATGTAIESLSQKYISIHADEGTMDSGTALDVHTGNIKELPQDSVVYTETRDSDNVRVLGGRVNLWRCVLAALQCEPERLIYGGAIDEYMTLVHIFRKRVEINTHNFLLEALLLTGVPGFLFVLAFTVILSVRMIKVFFSRESDGRAKLLTVTLAALLVRNMGEAQILRTDDITNYLFFFAAGVFLAYSYELFPEKALPVKLPEKNNGK